ncbi:MAG: tripartite tricarboxylate transporter TctB family protein [Enhydrobacter sp.]
MLSRRTLEAATAILTGAFGVAVVASSLNNGIDWSESGVESGTFPFITGTIVVVASLYNLVRGWLRGTGIVATRQGLQRTAALFLPAAFFVALIPLIGMYVGSVLYLFGSLRLQSHLSTVRSALIAVVASVALYVVFERLFQVSLPHGWLGAVLDL